MIRASPKYRRALLGNGGSSSTTTTRNTGCPTTTMVRSFSSSSVIPERNLWDTIYSGTKGFVSLLVSEESRQKFMDIVSGSQTINADVLKQARFGSMLTIALFHDLQDPLFQRYKFNAKDFLTGVQPALTNFHDTLGTLQNEFPEVTSKEERAELLMERFRQIATTQMNAAPESPWTAQAQSDPNSSAGKLSKMVSPRLFNSLFLTTETEAMMSKYKEGTTKVSYVALLSARAMVMDGEDFTTGTSSSTNTAANDDIDENVTPTVEAIKKLDKKEEEDARMETAAIKDDSKKDEEKIISKIEKAKGAEDNVMKSNTDEELSSKETPEEDRTDEEKITATEEKGEDEEDDDVTPVAAQIEVLYEMNQTIDVKPLIFSMGGGGGHGGEHQEGQQQEQEQSSSSSSVETQTKDETQIWVGTFEGWLNGSPDGGPLRWKITHLRPPHAEFPGLYHASFRRS